MSTDYDFEQIKSVAYMHLRRNELDLAYRFYMQVLDICPGDFDTVNCIGHIYSRQAANTKVLQLYIDYERDGHTRKLDTENLIRFNINLGKAYSRSMRFEEALQRFEDAKKLGASRALVLEAFANLYFDSKNYQAAYQTYQELVACKQNAVWPRIALAKTQSKLGDYSSALSTLDKAKMISPTDYELEVEIGHVYMATASYDEAVTHYEQAMALAPNDPYVAVDLGIAYFYKSQFTEAKKALKAAILTNPDDARILFYLGHSELCTNNLREAAGLFEKAIVSAPDSYPDAYKWCILINLKLCNWAQFFKFVNLTLQFHSRQRRMKPPTSSQLNTAANP